MRKFIPVFLLVALVGCANLVSNFDQNSFNATQRIKTETMDLIVHGVEQSSNYTTQINGLRSDLSAQVAYEMGKGKNNGLTVKQWQLLSSNDHLLGKFLKKWEVKPLSTNFVTESVSMINDSFDQIINLEGAKIK